MNSDKFLPLTVTTIELPDDAPELLIEPIWFDLPVTPHNLFDERVNYCELPHYIREKYPEFMPAEVLASLHTPYGSTMPEWLMRSITTLDLKIKQFNLAWIPEENINESAGVVTKRYSSFKTFESNFIEGKNRHKHEILGTNKTFGITLARTEMRGTYSVQVFQRDKVLGLGEIKINKVNLAMRIYTLSKLYELLKGLDQKTMMANMVGQLQAKKLDTVIKPAYVYKEDGRLTTRSIEKESTRVWDMTNIIPLNDECINKLVSLAKFLYRNGGAPLIKVGHLKCSDINLKKYVYQSDVNAIGKLEDYERSFILPVTIFERDTKQLSNAISKQMVLKDSEADNWSDTNLHYLYVARITDLKNKLPTNVEYLDAKEYAVFVDDIAIPGFKKKFKSLDQAIRYFRKTNNQPTMRFSMGLSV
jgi:hypothetical protein